MAEPRGMPVKYELRAVGGELAFIRQENAKMPLRAMGFLQFSGKDSRSRLMCEVKNGEILLWVEEKPSVVGKNPLSHHDER